MALPGGTRKLRRGALRLVAVAAVCCAYPVVHLLFCSAPKSINRTPRVLLRASGSGIDRRQSLQAALLGAGLLGGNAPANAIFGGGKDFAGLTLSEKVNGPFDGKDFSKQQFRLCIGRGINFKGSKFVGSDMQKADLAGSNFAGADLTSASLENAILDGVDFSGAKLDASYHTISILQAKNLKDATFDGALFPKGVADKLCERPDVQASQATKDSIPCP